MGCNASKKDSPEDQAEKAKSKNVDKLINAAQTEDSLINKLLLLGAGESGKSTLFKQMISIYGKGFPDEERATFRPIIYQNIMTAVNVLCQQAEERKIRLGSKAEAAKDRLTNLTAERGDEKLTAEMAGLVKTLWTDKGIQDVYGMRSQFQLADSAKYYLDKVDTIAADDYLPSEQDVLRSRVRTTGIVENEFEIDKNKFKMYDVGGQRNERKKWIHCFENVTAVIFVAAISEYDQVLYEDENTNRMHEALTLFDQICNSRWFQKTSIILFLNKRDIFQEKLARKVPLTQAWPEYTGSFAYEEAVDFIQGQFFALNKSKEKEIYAHCTCATDTENVSHVFNSVKDIVIKNSLAQAGLTD